MSVYSEESHLTLRIATIGAVRVGLDNIDFPEEHSPRMGLLSRPTLDQCQLRCGRKTQCRKGFQEKFASSREPGVAWAVKPSSPSRERALWSWGAISRSAQRKPRLRRFALQVERWSPYSRAI